MMREPVRIAVLADIHGNLPAFEAVVADLRGQGSDAVAIAGDMASGVWAEEVVAGALALGRWVIAGNHEKYYTDYDQGVAPVEYRTGRQWQAMRWCYERMTRRTLDQMAALPGQCVIEIDGAAPIRLVHGSLRSDREHLFPDREPEALDHFRAADLLGPDDYPPALDDVLADAAEPVVVCGHSHIPWVQRTASRLVVNAGAVGGAINGDVRAQYAVLEWDGARWSAMHRCVDYDVTRVREGALASGYLVEGGAFARALLDSVETGRNVPGTFLRYVWQVATEGGYNHGPIPDALWDEAVSSFAWRGGR